MIGAFAGMVDPISILRRLPKPRANRYRAGVPEAKQLRARMRRLRQQRRDGDITEAQFLASECEAHTDYERN